MKRNITFQEANQRFIDQGRNDIQLCEDGYEGWNKKSKFYDLIEKDYFYSIPVNVFRQKSCHPVRSKEKYKQSMLETYGVDNPSKSEKINQKRKQTNLEKYGVEHCLQSEIVKDKSKQTNIEKYGVENPKQSKLIQEKCKQTNLEKYGVEYPVQNINIKEKIKQTMMEKYSVEYSLQSESLKEKIKQTMLNTYGVEYPIQNINIKSKMKQTNLDRYGIESPIKLWSIKEKSKQTMLKKYGVQHHMETNVSKNKLKQTMIKKYGAEYYSQVNAKKVFGTNTTIPQWLDNQLDPKPSILTIHRYFKNKKDYINEEDLNNFIKNYKENKTSLEILGENLFNSKHFNCKVQNTNLIYRPDFKLSETIFVNVDGLYWHSEEQKDKNYHFEMRKHFEENNLRIFQFHENEIKTKSHIVKSIVNNSLGLTKHKIFARKCEIKPVSHKEAILFLNNNHLMCSTTAKHVGLYFQNQLVSILSYKEKKNICKIERFCNLVGHNIPGSFSRLLKHIERNCLKSSTIEIHNWVDLRYGTGNHLSTKGFKLIKETIGWKWTDCYETYNRLKCKANMDERKLTELQHAEELGWFRVYDAGQRLFVKTIIN
jgi:hypothetical protein